MYNPRLETVILGYETTGKGVGPNSPVRSVYAIYTTAGVKIAEKDPNTYRIEDIFEEIRRESPEIASSVCERLLKRDNLLFLQNDTLNP